MRPRTIIPLEFIANALNLNPWHFWSVDLPNISPTQGNAQFACNDVWFEYDWQDISRISRFALTSALAIAENDVFAVTNFFPTPVWTTDEVHPYPKHFRVGSYAGGLDARGRLKTIELDMGYFIAGGVKGMEEIELEADVTFDDLDGDGINETCIVIVAVADDVLPEEVRIFYPGHDGEEEYEIRPITVEIAANVATITYKKYLAVLEAIIENINTTTPMLANGENDDDFLDEVDVYRIYNDPSTQAVCLRAEGCTTGCDGEQTTACLRPRNKEKPIVEIVPGTWDDEEEEWTAACLCYEPDSVAANYYSGVTKYLRKGWYYPSTDLVQTMALYAISLVEGEFSGCESFMGIVRSWREPHNTNKYFLDPVSLANPFEPTRAGVKLWRWVKRNRLYVGKSAIV